jgi:polyhydroxybutyrate depolymerase
MENIEWFDKLRFSAIFDIILQSISLCLNPSTMKRFTLILAISLSAITLFPQDYSFTWDGLERTYNVHLPTGYTPDLSYPLVINMHGLGSNAFQQELYSRFSELADEEGIVVVYPNGFNNLWNVFSASGVDDVGFLSALIDTMAFHYSIDLNRVYATGMSMGGYMSHRLACQLEERIAAIASVTGLLAFSPCVPSRNMPILQIHGTDDGVVPYSGVQGTIDHWTDWNDCPDDPEVVNLPDIDTTDQSTVTVSSWFPCNDSVEVMLYTINGGDHTWPGSPPIIGVTNQDIDANVEIWNFFMNYTVLGPTDVEENPGMEPKTFGIFPNPARESVVIWPPEEDMGIEWTLNIFEITGRAVFGKLLGKGDRFTISLGQMPPGIYIFELTGGSKAIRKKVIME